MTLTTNQILRIYMKARENKKPNPPRKHHNLATYG